MPQYKPSDFSHPYTPEHLQTLNAQVATVINDVPLDSQALIDLIDQRDQYLQEYIAGLSEQLELKQSFIEAEVVINNKLIEICKTLFSTTEKELINLKKGQKAVQHYK